MVYLIRLKIVLFLYFGKVFVWVLFVLYVEWIDNFFCISRKIILEICLKGCVIENNCIMEYIFELVVFKCGFVYFGVIE